MHPLPRERLLPFLGQSQFALLHHLRRHEKSPGSGHYSPIQGAVFFVVKNVIPPENIGAINAGSFAAIMSIKKERPGQARQLIHSLLSKAGLKKVIIVDDDIDVFNPIEVEWAVQFRSCAEDYILTSELPAINLDPMISTPPNLLRKVGIDATLPLSGDKKGRVEILRDLGPARYPDLDEVDLEYYLGS